MVTTRLDEIDRKILAELQADGRMTNVELAKRVGISAPPISISFTIPPEFCSRELGKVV